MSNEMDTPAGKGRAAPWYSIPPGELVSVEHPCIVRNVDKAVETLQGPQGISAVGYDLSAFPFALLMLFLTNRF